VTRSKNALATNFEPLLLVEALTHPSVGLETRGDHLDNQRLEFLGDAVLHCHPTLFDTSMRKRKAG
jgi:ribonuclease-3